MVHRTFPWAACRRSRPAAERFPRGASPWFPTWLRSVRSPVGLRSSRSHAASMRPHRCGVGDSGIRLGACSRVPCVTVATCVCRVPGPIVPRRWSRAWTFLVQTHGKPGRHERSSRQRIEHCVGYGTGRRLDGALCTHLRVRPVGSPEGALAALRRHPMRAATTCLRADSPELSTEDPPNCVPCAPRFRALGAKPVGVASWHHGRSARLHCRLGERAAARWTARTPVLRPSGDGRQPSPTARTPVLRPAEEFR